jgi:hypothetical protein
MYGFFFKIIATHLQLPTERIDVSLTQLRAGGGVEAAIDATALTKWNMYVYTSHSDGKITNFV